MIGFWPTPESVCRGDYSCRFMSVEENSIVTSHLKCERAIWVFLPSLKNFLNRRRRREARLMNYSALKAERSEARLISESFKVWQTKFRKTRAIRRQCLFTLKNEEAKLALVMKTAGEQSLAVTRLSSNKPRPNIKKALAKFKKNEQLQKYIAEGKQIVGYNVKFQGSTLLYGDRVRAELEKAYENNVDISRTMFGRDAYDNPYELVIAKPGVETRLTRSQEYCMLLGEAGHAAVNMGTCKNARCPFRSMKVIRHVEKHLVRLGLNVTDYSQDWKAYTLSQLTAIESKLAHFKRETPLLTMEVESLLED